MQQRQQIGPAQGGVGGSVAVVHGGPQCQTAQPPGGQRVAHMQMLRKSCYCCQCIPQTPTVQQPGYVGADLDARTDLAQRRRALKHAHIPPGPRARQGRRHAPNACARNE